MSLLTQIDDPYAYNDLTELIQDLKTRLKQLTREQQQWLLSNGPNTIPDNDATFLARRQEIKRIKMEIDICKERDAQQHQLLMVTMPVAPRAYNCISRSRPVGKARNVTVNMNEFAPVIDVPLAVSEAPVVNSPAVRVFAQTDVTSTIAMAQDDVSLYEQRLLEQQMKRGNINRPKVQVKSRYGTQL